MRLEDLNEYYDNLCDTFDRGEMDFVMNHDRAHNAVIECFMLNKSNVINMYCGEMSVFREGFYNHINQDSSTSLNLRRPMTFSCSSTGSAFHATIS
mgnify:CR=1 FL=1